MAFGGGTFTSFTKTIPGVYANFENVELIENAPTTGYVAFVLPFITKQIDITFTWSETSRSYVSGTPVQKDFELPEVATITSTNYSQKSVIFANEDYYPVANILAQLKEILVNATQVFVIPISYQMKKETYVGGVDDGKVILKSTCLVTNSDPDVEMLRKKLTKYQYNTLLLNDYFDDGYNCSLEDTYSVFPIFTIFEEFIEKSNKRFQFVFKTRNNDLYAKIDAEAEIYMKWFVTPYYTDSAYYITGMLSSLEPGQSSAGHLYRGFMENAMDWIPESLTEQERSLEYGLISFYTIGSTNLRILKDITTAHQDRLNNKYNNRMGQIVRLEKYMYDWFSYLYVTSIQGYPNNPSYRRVIKGLIVDQLKQMEANNVVQNVNASDVIVSPIEGKPNAILIEIHYKPVSGIDYVYITFWVD